MAVEGGHNLCKSAWARPLTLGALHDYRNAKHIVLWPSKLIFRVAGWSLAKLPKMVADCSECRLFSIFYPSVKSSADSRSAPHLGQRRFAELLLAPHSLQ